MVRWLRLWIRTRRQKSIRRLRGNVASDGDIHASRVGRVTTDLVSFGLGVRSEVVQALTPIAGG